MSTTHFTVLNTKKLLHETACGYVIVPKDYDIRLYKLLEMDIVDVCGVDRYMKRRPRHPSAPSRVNSSSLYATLKMNTGYNFIPMIDRLAIMAADTKIIDASKRHKTIIDKLYNTISADQTMLGEADLFEKRFRILHSAGIINNTLNNSLTGLVPYHTINSLYTVANDAIDYMFSTSKQQTLLELKKDIYATSISRLGYYTSLHHTGIAPSSITYGQFIDIKTQETRYGALKRVNYYITSEVGISSNRFSDIYVPLYLSKNSGTYGNSKINMFYYYDMCIMASEGTFTANNSSFEDNIMSFNLINSLSEIFSNSSTFVNSKNQDIFNATNRIDDTEEDIDDIPEDIPVQLPGVLTLYFPDRNVRATHYTVKVVELKNLVDTERYNHSLYRMISGQTTKDKLIRPALETRKKHMKFDRGKYIYSTTDHVSKCDIAVNAGDVLAIYVRAENEWLSTSYSDQFIVDINNEMIVNLPGRTPADIITARGRYLNAIYRKEERRIVKQIDETVRLFKAGMLDFITHEEAASEVNENI